MNPLRALEDEIDYEGPLTHGHVYLFDDDQKLTFLITRLQDLLTTKGPNVVIYGSPDCEDCDSKFPPTYISWPQTEEERLEQEVTNKNYEKQAIERDLEQLAKLKAKYEV